MPIKIEPNGTGTKSGRTKNAIKASQVLFRGSQDIGFLLPQKDLSHNDRVDLYGHQGVTAADGNIKVATQDG